MENTVAKEQIIYSGFRGDWPATRIHTGAEERARAAAGKLELKEKKEVVQEAAQLSLFAK